MLERKFVVCWFFFAFIFKKTWKQEDCVWGEKKKKKKGRNSGAAVGRGCCWMAGNWDGTLTAAEFDAAALHLVEVWKSQCPQLPAWTWHVYDPPLKSPVLASSSVCTSLCTLPACYAALFVCFVKWVHTCCCCCAFCVTKATNWDLWWTKKVRFCWSRMLNYAAAAAVMYERFGLAAPVQRRGLWILSSGEKYSIAVL